MSFPRLLWFCDGCDDFVGEVCEPAETAVDVERIESEHRAAHEIRHHLDVLVGAA